MQAGFVDLGAYIPGISVEARYATSHNLTGHPLAGYCAEKAFATVEAANALQKAVNVFRQMGYGVLIYDAYRPQKAVNDFVVWSQEEENFATKAEFYPALEKADLFPMGYIARRSGHTRGSTIDLTLFDAAAQKDLDMGGGFDYFGELSWAGYTRTLTQEQIANRRLLREMMVRHGFRPLEEEWWHFTLVEEPYPDVYFDFLVERL